MPFREPFLVSITQEWPKVCTPFAYKGAEIPGLRGWVSAPTGTYLTRTTKHGCRYGAAYKGSSQRFVRTGTEAQGSMAKNVRWYGRGSVTPARSREISSERGATARLAARRGPGEP